MRMFPILIGYEGTKGPCPSSIPWDAIAPYEGHALANHQQSLERLAERGGLSPTEAYLVMTGRRWKGETFTAEFEKEACAFLDKLVRDREQLRADHDRYKAALEEIRKTAGPYSQDRLEHLTNKIEAMKALAVEALEGQA